VLDAEVVVGVEDRYFVFIQTEVNGFDRQLDFDDQNGERVAEDHFVEQAVVQHGHQTLVVCQAADKFAQFD